jgi:hypothetical protein
MKPCWLFQLWATAMQASCPILETKRQPRNIRPVTVNGVRNWLCPDFDSGTESLGSTPVLLAICCQTFVGCCSYGHISQQPVRIPALMSNTVVRIDPLAQNSCFQFLQDEKVGGSNPLTPIYWLISFGNRWFSMYPSTVKRVEKPAEVFRGCRVLGKSSSLTAATPRVSQAIVKPSP